MQALPVNVALSDSEQPLNLSGEDVRCTTLDNLLTNLGVVLRDVKILKIDVEGMGLKVLKGGLKTLQNAHPHIFLEVHNKEEAKAKFFLEELGYKILMLPGASYIATPKPTDFR